MKNKRKSKSGGYGSIHKMSNMKLLGELKCAALSLSKNSELAKKANEALKDMGLPRCNFREDFKIKSYHDKLFEEATNRGLLKHNNINS